LINCPTCGRPNPETQHFCGNCGTDLQAARSFRAPAAQEPPTPAPRVNPPPMPSAPPAAQSAPAPTQVVFPPPASLAPAYGYEAQAYDYAPAQPQRLFGLPVFVAVFGIAFVCLCCGFFLATFGWWLYGPMVPFPFLPATTPAQTPTPTTESLQHLLNFLS
jgi:hypothetical protein